MTGRVGVADVSRAPEPAEAEPRSRTLFGEPLRRLILVALGLFIVDAALVITSTHRAPELSPFDEWTHADYAYQISHGHIPAKGSLIAPEILREFACHGLWTPISLPPCGLHNPPPSAYPDNGENYNFSHPPLYYALTGFTARAVDAVLPGEHFITLARVVGVLWLFAAAMVLYVGVRRFEVVWQIALAAAACLGLCPLVLHADSTVNNDAAAPLSGALAIWLLARILVQGRTGWVVPCLLTLACTATKVLNGLPFLIVLAILAVIVLARRRTEPRTSRQLLVTAMSMALAFVVVYKGWAIFQSGRGLAHWVSPIAGVSDRPVRGFPFDELLSNSFTGLNFVSSYYLPTSINGRDVVIWNSLLAAVLSAAPFVCLLAFRARTSRWLVGLVALVGVVSYPLVVELQGYVENRTYFPSVVARYGITFVPWLLAALALAVNTRGWRRISLAFAAAGTAVMLGATTGIYS